MKAHGASELQTSVKSPWSEEVQGMVSVQVEGVTKTSAIEMR